MKSNTIAQVFIFSFVIDTRLTGIGSLSHDLIGYCIAHPYIYLIGEKNWQA